MKQFICVFGILLAGQAIAEEFYCGSTIVEQGMTMDQVTSACGEPSSVNENAWYYLQGPGQLVKVVYFNGGEVDFIKEESPSTDEEQEQENI